MPAWVEEGVQEYQRRLPKDFAVSVKEIPSAQQGKKRDVGVIMEREGQQLLAALEHPHVVVLDKGGKSWSTEKLADQVRRWQQQSPAISIVIGGPDGLAQSCLQRADQIWSLSALTLPHPLVRVVLMEQLYRAWSILHNHPYHK